MRLSDHDTNNNKFDFKTRIYEFSTLCVWKSCGLYRILIISNFKLFCRTLSVVSPTKSRLFDFKKKAPRSRRQLQNAEPEAPPVSSSRRRQSLAMDANKASYSDIVAAARRGSLFVNSSQPGQRRASIAVGPLHRNTSVTDATNDQGSAYKRQMKRTSLVPEMMSARRDSVTNDIKRMFNVTCSSFMYVCITDKSSSSLQAFCYITKSIVIKNGKLLIINVDFNHRESWQKMSSLWKECRWQEHFPAHSTVLCRAVLRYVSTRVDSGKPLKCLKVIGDHCNI